MGFLKKLQDANPDEGTSDGLGAEEDLSRIPEPVSVSPASDAEADPEKDKADKEQKQNDEDKAPDEQASLEAEVIPAEVVMLELMLRGHDWWYSYSDDSSVRKEGEKALNRITEQLQQCEKSGYLDDARKVWDKYAPKDYPCPNIFWINHNQPDPTIDVSAMATPGLPARRPGEPFSEPYNRHLYSRPFAAAAAFQGAPNANVPKQQQNPEMQHDGGGVQTNLLTKALSAPFAITAAAGSLIVDSLKFAGEKARGFYAKGRENGHAILGRQLDEAAGNIVEMTESLKQGGMGDLIADMKATGRPAREIFHGMTPGGPHQHFADRFSTLMKNEDFARQHAKLEDALSDFGFKASHYAQTGVELNRDYSDAVERNVEQISAATEGFIFKKDGVIKHLQELARSISETVSNMINNLLGRNKPQPQ